METFTNEKQESLGLWKGAPMRSLVAASCSRFGSQSMGFSQDVKFSSLKLQVLLLKASRYSEKALDSATVIFRPWWPFDTGWNVPVCPCRLPRKDSPSLTLRVNRAGPWHSGQTFQTPSSLASGEGQSVSLSNRCHVRTFRLVGLKVWSPHQWHQHHVGSC